MRAPLFLPSSPSPPRPAWFSRGRKPQNPRRIPDLEQLWREGGGTQPEMEHIAAAEERIVSDRLRRKLEEVNIAAREHLAPIQDHVNFTLQQAYFKCAYECFDRRRRQEDINNCVEHCSVPVLNANNFVEAEMAKFQERMQRALMVCQDRFEEAKLHKIKTSATTDLESCVDHAIQDGIQSLPRVVDRLKASFSLN